MHCLLPQQKIDLKHSISLKLFLKLHYFKAVAQGILQNGCCKKFCKITRKRITLELQAEKFTFSANHTELDLNAVKVTVVL